MPSSIQPIENQSINEDQNLTLTCQASGIPPPLVSWVKISGGLRTNSDHLVFTNINRSESGEYRCEATNSCGNVSKSLTIDVQCEFCPVLFEPIKQSFKRGYARDGFGSEMQPECFQCSTCSRIRIMALEKTLKLRETC